MSFEAARGAADVRVFDQLQSTFDVVDDAAGDFATWVTLDQRAGRGRLGRSWTAQPGSSLAASILLRPPPPAADWAWLPLVVGLAVVHAIDPFVAGKARLKWPNDVLVEGRKVAGILCERRGDLVIAGIGVNLTTERENLPVETATSLTLEGAEGTAAALADAVLHDVLRQLHGLVPRLAEPAVRDAIAGRLVTLGTSVRVQLPGDRELTGVARSLGDGGELEIDTGEAIVSVAAGDVTHLR